MTERNVILHYHLFKNAGTSFDRILQNNFAKKWVTTEFARQAGGNTPMVVNWIEKTPEALAFSSHTMMGRLPRIEGINIISALFLRDPVARILSAYKFERRQGTSNLGARLAKEHDLAGYVRARLAIEGDRQCRNFQVRRLSLLVPGKQSELDRAIMALDRLSFVGRVEKFEESIERFADLARQYFPTFRADVVHANTTEKSIPDIDEETARLLETNNAEDRILLEHFDKRFL